MPLAFTQEDFLVKKSLHIIVKDNIFSPKKDCYGPH